jgi:hypothetical protein
MHIFIPHHKGYIYIHIYQYLRLPRSVQTDSGTHPVSSSRGSVFGVLNGQGVKITTHLRVVPKVRMRRAVLMFPLQSVTAYTKISLSSIMLLRSRLRERDMAQFSLFIPTEITLLSLLGKYSAVPMHYEFTSADLD